MDLPDAIARFLTLPGAEETMPFGPDVLVYKVGGKMFALAVPDDFPSRSISSAIRTEPSC